MKIFAPYSIAILLVLLACYMVYADKDCWGWVIIAALISVPTITYEKK